MELIIDLISFLCALTGVLLTTRILPFLRPTERKREDDIFWVIDGGSSSTDFTEENRQKDVDRTHEIYATRYGSVLVFLSIVISQIPTFGNIEMLNVRIPKWSLYVGILFLSLLIAWLISLLLTEKAVKKWKEKFSKQR